ncbi:MAG: class I SAM-dependent methyltransferase [Candidatus Nanopelagicales bacterium]
MAAWRSDLDRNRAIWAVVNEQFTDAAADDAWRAEELSWGLFARPESELRVVGDVAGLDVVDLAGGTAYVAAVLHRHGARVLSLDLSWEQLATARRCQQAYGPDFPLVQADAEHLPLRSSAYDLVLSEHGAAAWCEPDAWVGEAARVLRPGGRLVFLTNSLLSALCVPEDEGVAQELLLRGQRDVRRVEWPGGGVEHHPSHGDWIRVLTSHGFVVEALHELYAPDDAHDHEFYDIATADWSAQWPPEELWVARLSP